MLHHAICHYPPSPIAPPAWARSLLPDLPKTWLGRGIGIELFAGVGRITKAFRSLGLPVLDPWDIIYGPSFDIFNTRLDTILSETLSWVWLAPPCCSFSLLRNLGKGDPLRSIDEPHGNESHPHFAAGNDLWRRALQIARRMLGQGVDIALEHPKGSYNAWE